MTALITTHVVVAFLALQLIASLVSQAQLPGGRLGEAGGVLLAATCTSAFLLLQRRLITGDGRVRVLACLVVASALGVLLLGGWSLIGLALAAVMATLRLPRGLLAAAGVTLITMLVVAAGTQDSVQRIVIPSVGWLVGLALASLTRLVVVHNELRLAQERLARSSVDEERHRIERDLHALMGRTLVAASMRSETAIRLIDRDVGACRTQLLQLQETLTSGQAKLREITTGPVIIDLETEFEAAKSLFGRLGIEHAFVMTADLAPRNVKVVGLVLREAVTNLLKHSRPQRCWITIRDESSETVLSVVNDGCPPTAATREGGTGLREMADQVAALGGTLEARPVPPRMFVVTCRLPRVDSEG